MRFFYITLLNISLNPTSPLSFHLISVKTKWQVCLHRAKPLPTFNRANCANIPLYVRLEVAAEFDDKLQQSLAALFLRNCSFVVALLAKHVFA